MFPHACPIHYLHLLINGNCPSSCKAKMVISSLFLDVSKSTSDIQYDQKLTGSSFNIYGEPDQLSITAIHSLSLGIIVIVSTSLPSAICPFPYRSIARDMARITLLGLESDYIILLNKTLQGFSSHLK